MTVDFVYLTGDLKNKIRCFMEKKELCSHCQSLLVPYKLQSRSCNINFQPNCKPACLVDFKAANKTGPINFKKATSVKKKQTKTLSLLFHLSLLPSLSFLLPFSVQFRKATLVTNARPNLDNLKWFHLKIHNSATSEETFIQVSNNIVSRIRGSHLGDWMALVLLTMTTL